MASQRARPGTRVSRLMLVAWWCLLAAVAAPFVVSPASAANPKVQELSGALLGDPSYKVRLTAALALGKLGDREAVPSLIRALGDEHKMVRGVAAQALGHLGDGAAAGPLEALRKRDPDPFVRGQAEKALKLIASATTPGAKKAKIYLHFGAFTGGVESPAEFPKLLRDTLQRELGKLGNVTTTLPPGVTESTFPKSGMLGFLIDGNITRLDDERVGGVIETSADVRVMVARWPSRSIIMWTNAGATVQGGSRQQDRTAARRECLDATANQLVEDLGKFFQQQGG